MNENTLESCAQAFADLFSGLPGRREKRELGYFSMRSRLKISSSRPRDIWATFELSRGRDGDIMNSLKYIFV